MKNVYTKPWKLRLGDKVGLISPAAPIAALAKHRVDLAVKHILDIGLIPVLGENALSICGMHSASPEERASDIMRFFKDPDIKGIIALIGGYGFEALIPHLDFQVIARNPKIYVGHSGNCILQLAMLQKTGLITFYGPHALTQFGEPFGPISYMQEHFARALMREEPIGRIEPSKEWTDEILNWFDVSDMARPRQPHPNAGYKWLREGQAEGVLIGGCLSSLQRLRGTPYWPDFKESLFFWEIAPSPGNMHKGYAIEAVDSQLASLNLTGMFNGLNGMIVGRPVRYTTKELALFEESILENTKKYDFPILANVDIGHTDPIITLPIGVKARINSKMNSFDVIEAAVKPI